MSFPIAPTMALDDDIDLNDDECDLNEVPSDHDDSDIVFASPIPVTPIPGLDVPPLPTEEELKAQQTNEFRKALEAAPVSSSSEVRLDGSFLSKLLCIPLGLGMPWFVSMNCGPEAMIEWNSVAGEISADDLVNSMYDDDDDDSSVDREIDRIREEANCHWD